MAQTFYACATRKEFNEAKGRDWARVVKVDGGYIGFDSMTDYKNWKNQKWESKVTEPGRIPRHKIPLG